MFPFLHGISGSAAAVPEQQPFLLNFANFTTTNNNGTRTVGRDFKVLGSEITCLGMRFKASFSTTIGIRLYKVSDQSLVASKSGLSITAGVENLLYFDSPVSLEVNVTYRLCTYAWFGYREAGSDTPIIGPATQLIAPSWRFRDLDAFPTSTGTFFAPIEPIISCIAGVTGVIDVPQAEANMLAAFYDATGGDDWVTNTGWKTDQEVANWYGVTVTAGHVSAVVLNFNNLTGNATAGIDWSVLDNYLVNLKLSHNPEPTNDLAGDWGVFNNNTVMRFLDLGPTHFTGGFDDLANLTLLEHLEIQDCTVDAGVLGDLAPLTGIIRLNMVFTILPAGTHDIASLTFIADPTEYIDIRVTGAVRVTGDLAALPAWANLPILRISGQNLTVSGPTNLGGMVSLQILWLSDNGFSQGELDQILADIYAARALYTSTPLTLLIEGNDAEASGTYQYSAAPSTGKEYIYALANDDDVEGFNTWNITYTEGGNDVTVP